MRKLTMLGLSLLLSVGAYAQAHLQQAKAQKASVATEKTEQTVSLKSKYSNNVRTRSASSGTAGFVEQVVGTSKALTPKKGSSRAKSAVTTDKIYAGMIYPQALLGGGKINVSASTYTPIVKASAGAHSIGVNPAANELYLISYNSTGSGVNSISVGAYDLTTGAVKRSRSIASQEDFDVFIQRGAYVPEDNAFYGFCNNGWAKLDCSTLESSLLQAYDNSSLSNIIFSNYTFNSNTQTIVAGKFFKSGSSELYTVNKLTGAAVKLADINVTSQYIGGFGYDYSSNSYLYNPNDDSTSEIVSIDASTYAVTSLCTLAGAPETACIYVDEVKPADPLAPLAPEFVRATFPNGSFSGTLTFTLPTQNSGNEDLTGTVSYTIKANDTEIASGSAAPGAEVSANYQASASGEVTFSCTASQGTHVSKTASQVIYIGNDTPAAPANVKLTPATVSWDPVTTGVHNGYIDAAKITYTVKINGNVVAEGQTATSCPTNLPVTAEIQNYVATVTATCNGITGPEGSSNDVLFGQPFSLPASFEPDAQQASLFTILDVNNDNKAWTYYAPSEGAPDFRITYNSRLASNDYLILPPVIINDTKNLCEFTFNAWAGSTSYVEKLEVWIGQENTAAGMTTKILDTTDITWRTAKEMKCYFQVPTTGKWYVAVKAVSDKDKLRLCVNNFNISVSDVAAKGPAAVENVTVVPGAQGALNATVKFNLPTKDNLGNALSGQVSATVETEVDYKTVTGAAGSAQSVEVMTLQGDNDITIQTMQGNVLGFPVTVSAYTGVEVPDVVSDLVMTPGNTAYSLYGKFTAPETGADGGYINKADLTYTVHQRVQIGSIFEIPIYDYPVIVDLGKNTEFSTSDMIPEGTEQAQYVLGVAATNEAGTSDISLLGVILGKPYDMPAIEDFADTQIDLQPLMLNTQGGMTYQYLSAAGIEQINPDFATKGAAIVAQGTDNQYGFWYPPMISTKGANKATFELQYYVGACKNVVVYAEAYGVPEEVIFNESYLMGYPEGFQTLPIELPAKFQDKDWVKISIRCDFSADKQYFVWNGYRLINLVQKDMAAIETVAPKKVATGADYDVTVDIANYGLNAATAYTVELYANGEKVAEKAGAELASFADGQVVFAQSMSPIATEPIEYYGAVVQAGDANMANNETAVVTVTPKQSTLPGATELTAANSENSVALTWNEPDLTAVTPDPKTDDFEDADAFAAEYGDWVFVDVDEEVVGGFQNMDLPGITPGETKGSFWVWDQSTGIGNQTFDAHSGDKYLFSLFSYQDNEVNDWAISPQLYGGEQTVSFWARSYSGDYPEKIAVYYSTGSTDPNDFVLVEGSEVDVVPTEWTEYQIDLPEGATRFAIRSYAAGSFMLMVDDVTYTPAAAFSGEISLKGYDVYRDGVKLNDAPVEKTDYADANVVEGTTYDYVVVALFDEGAGRVSNTATIKFEKEQSGLDELGAAKAIATAKNTIIVRGFAGEKVVVSSADGKVIANGEASEISSISVPAGVYVVTAGNKSVKVVVK